MTTVTNKTQKPLSIPLPGGKKLHLGPGKTGQIAAKAAADPQLKKLIDAGELEVVDDNAPPTSGPGTRQRGRGFMVGHGSSSGGRRSGDR
jgi:hypothetical protein